MTIIEGIILSLLAFAAKQLYDLNTKVASLNKPDDWIIESLDKLEGNMDNQFKEVKELIRNKSSIPK